MTRLAGAALVLAGCMACALGASGRLYARLVRQETLCRALELAERELSLNRTPLPELLERMARCGGKVEPCFALTLGSIEMGKSFTEAWSSSLAESELDAPTARSLETLGRILGSYDAEGQGAAVCRVREELEGRLPALREQARARRRVYAALGAAAGGALILLFL